MATQRYKEGSLERVKTARGLCWYLRYSTTQNGELKRPRLRVGLVSDFPSKSAASKAAKVLREQINRTPEEIAVLSRTFGDVIDRYIREELPTRHSTSKAYLAMLRVHIRPAWGHESLAEVKSMRVRNWLKQLPISTRYRGHIHGMMRVLFRYSMLWEWVPTGENPMSLFRTEGSTKRSKEPRVLSAEQFARLLEVIIQEPYRTMVIGAMCLGLRCSELLALQWSDFDFLKGSLRIERAVVDGHHGAVKTVHSKKKLPIDAALAQVFQAWRRQSEFNKDEDWVFASPQMAGEQPYWPTGLQYRVLRPAGERIGLDFNLGWHTFRHSFKVQLERSGADIVVQRDLMRHADVRTTQQVYGEVEFDRMQAASSKAMRLILPERVQ